MKRFLLIMSTAMVAALLSLTLVGTSAAHASTVPRSSIASPSHHLAPAISGGGCTDFTTQGPGTSFASYQACISSFGLLVLGDTYFTFGASNASLWSKCTVTINLLDQTTNQFIESSTIDCLRDARNSAYYVHYTPNDGSIGVSSGHQYTTRVGWSGIYSGTYIQGNYFFSPALFT